MKRLLIVILVLAGLSALAQRNQSTGKPIKKDNFIIDIGYCSLINPPPNIRFDIGYSAAFQLFYDHQFKAKVLSGAIGIGYSNDNYYNNGYISHKDSIKGDYTTFYPFGDLDSTVKRNKYVTNYFDIPVELRFRSKPNIKGHSWKASLGFRVGFRLGSHTRTMTSDGRFETYNHDALRKVRYGLTARFGYGRVGVFGYYGITRLFEDNRGWELIPWSVGFTLSPF
jgi:hypothetical protein